MEGRWWGLGLGVVSGGREGGQRGLAATTGGGRWVGSSEGRRCSSVLVVERKMEMGCSCRARKGSLVEVGFPASSSFSSSSPHITRRHLDEALLTSTCNNSASNLSKLHRRLSASPPPVAANTCTNQLTLLHMRKSRPSQAMYVQSYSPSQELGGPTSAHLPAHPP